MHTHTAVTSRDIQSDNFKAMSAAKLTRGEQLVMNAVRLAHARRRRDLSLNEICLVMEEQLGKRVNPNGISGRVTSLVASRRLARGPARACSVTGAKCEPVYAVARQAELGAYQARTAQPSAAPAAAPAAPQAAGTARSGGVPPEVRARLAALKESAAQGR